MQNTGTRIEWTNTINIINRINCSTLNIILLFIQCVNNYLSDMEQGNKKKEVVKYNIYYVPK
jgi:hypothetical protein